MSPTKRAPAYERLLAELAKLPGIGRRSAERIALRHDTAQMRQLQQALATGR